MEMRAGLPILGFESAAAFESWLEAGLGNGAWLKIARKASQAITLTKREAVDAALCHGWIDGQLDRCDEDHFLIRFTPRRAGSRWSRINRDRAEALIGEGRMRPAGLAQVDAARADGKQTLFPTPLIAAGAGEGP